MRLDNLLQQLLFSLTGSSIPVTPGPVATAMHPKHLTQVLHRVALFKSLDYRELLRESDIKRAVVDSTGQCNIMHAGKYRGYQSATASFKDQRTNLPAEAGAMGSVEERAVA